MKKETKKAPIIRFRGFTDDWEQRKLAQFFFTATEKNDDGEYSQADILAASLGTELEKKHIFFGLRSTAESVKKYRKVQLGDIVYTKSPIKHYPNGIFRTCKKIPGIVPSMYCVYHKRGNIKINTSIVQCFFENKYRLDNYLRPLVNVGARNNVNITDEEALKGTITIPINIEEQTKIVNLIEKLTILITLHQHKLDQLKKLKKYFLQNMFPAKGEKVPRIRFKGFTGDWEQKKLIDVCDYVDYRGKTPSKTTSGIFLVTAKNIKDGYIDYESSQEYISENDYDEVMHRGKPKIGDVLITTEAPCGNVAQVNKENIALAQRIIKYRGHSHVMDNAYLKYYLLSPEFQEILYAKSSGGTVQGIKGSILHKQKISFPKYEEQVKIGQYLDDLDNLITLHQHKLEQLQTMKKFMLQNLFI